MGEGGLIKGWLFFWGGGDLIIGFKVNFILLHVLFLLMAYSDLVTRCEFNLFFVRYI